MGHPVEYEIGKSKVKAKQNKKYIISNLIILKYLQITVQMFVRYTMTTKVYKEYCLFRGFRIIVYWDELYFESKFSFSQGYLV